MLCVALASALYGLRGMVPEVLSMVFANAAAMAAIALIYHGGRAFFGLRRNTLLLIVALLLANLGLIYCFYVQDLYASRVVIFSSVSGVLLFLFGFDVLRHQPREHGRARFPYRFTAITVLFDALVSLARIVNAVLHPASSTDFLAPTPLNALYFATHGLLAMCISVGFILMLNERLHALLEHQLSHDPLTNAYSRPMIFELAQRELNSARRPFSLLLLDIDHFKQANDNLGHQGGDEVLRHFVNTLSANLRLNEPLGRYGGEEFVILLYGADAQAAAATAERLRQCVAETPYRHAQGEYSITTSIGHATAHAQENLEQLLQRADSALYCAKRKGRNRVEQA